MQAVYGVDPENSSVYQFQNTGDAEFYGWEAELVLHHLSGLQSGLQYTLIKRSNLSNPEIKFTDVPRHKLLVFLHYTVFSRLFLNLKGIYNSPRISSSNGMFQTSPLFTMDFITSFDISGSISLEASISNLLDASYSYVEGYPAPGRSPWGWGMHPWLKSRTAGICPASNSRRLSRQQCCPSSKICGKALRGCPGNDW